MDSNPHSTLQKPYEGMRVSGFKEPINYNRKPDAPTRTNTYLTAGKPAQRASLSSVARMNRAYELRMGAVRRLNQNLTPSSSQGSVHMFQRTSSQEGNFRSQLGERVHNNFQRKRQLTSQSTVESGEHVTHSNIVQMSAPPYSPPSSNSGPTKPKAVSRGITQPGVPVDQSIVIAPYGEQRDDVTVTSMWDSKRELQETHAPGMAVGELNVTMINRGEYHCEDSQISTDKDAQKHKQLYYRHLEVAPRQRTACTSLRPGESHPTDCWMNPNVLQMNCHSQLDYKVQFPQPSKSDRQVSSQVHLMEIKPEEVPTKTIHPQSGAKLTGDKATETNADDFTPYTCQSLSMEEELGEASGSPIVSMSAPKTQLTACKSLRSQPAFTYSKSSTMPLHQRQPLSQDHEHRYSARGFSDQVLSQTQELKSGSKRFGQDFVRTFFGCWKNKLTEDSQDDITTHSPYSQSNTASRDPSLADELRTPRGVITNTFRGSRTRCSSATQSGVHISPVEAALVSVLQQEAPDNQTHIEVEGKCPTAARIHANAERGRYLARKHHSTLRTPRSLTRLNKQMMEFVTQQHHAVNVVQREFSTFRSCLSDLTTQVNTMTLTLNEQQQVLRQLTQAVQSRDTVIECDNNVLKSPGRPLHACKPSPNCSAKPRHPEGYADFVETPTTAMPVSTSITVMDKERSHPHRQSTRHDSFPPRNACERENLNCESRSNSVVSCRGSPQQTSLESKHKLSTADAVSSEDYTVVTENFSKRSKESSFIKSLQAAERKIVERNNSKSNRKSSFSCAKGAQDGEIDHRYFSQLTTSGLLHHQSNTVDMNNAVVANAAAAHTDVVCYSQPTSGSSNESTEATIIEGSEPRLNHDNRALRHYYRIAYVEQDTAISQDALYRGQPDRLDPRKELPRIKYGSTLKEAKLVATEHVPCPQGESEAMRSSVVIDSSRDIRHLASPDVSGRKLNVQATHVSTRKKHSHESHHHAHRMEQPEQNSVPSRKAPSTCRRRALVGNDRETAQVSDSYIAHSTHRQTNFVNPSAQTCQAYNDTVLYPMQFNSYGMDPAASTRRDQNSRMDANEEDQPIKSCGFKQQTPCPKKRHKSAAAHRTQMSNMAAQSQNPNRSRRHGLVEDKYKVPTPPHRFALDHNNNSQDWGPSKQASAGSVFLSDKVKNLGTAQVAFDQLHKKKDLELHFVTSGLRTVSDTNSSRPMDYALPGPNEDAAETSVVKQHLSARRARTRAEQERQLWKELRALSVNRSLCKSDEASKAEQLQPRTVFQSVQRPEIHGESEVNSQQQPQQQQQQQSAVNQSFAVTQQGPVKEKTTLEKFREQRRRLFEEKAQEDMQQIVALTEKIMAERRTQTMHKNYQNSEQVSELLSDKPEVVDDIRDERLESERPQEWLQTDCRTVEPNSSIDQPPWESVDATPKNADKCSEEIQPQSREHGTQMSNSEPKTITNHYTMQPVPESIRATQQVSHSCNFRWNPTISALPTYGYFPCPWAFPALCNHAWVPTRPVGCGFPSTNDSIRYTSCSNLASRCCACDSCYSSDTPTPSLLSTSSTQTGCDDSDSWTTESSGHSSPASQTAAAPPHSMSQQIVAVRKRPAFYGQLQNYRDSQTVYNISRNNRIKLEGRHETSLHMARCHDPRW